MFENKKLFAALLLGTIVAIHLALVSSVLLQERSSISSLYHDAIYRYGKGADFYGIYHAGLNLRADTSPYAVNQDNVVPYYFPFRYLPIVAVAARAAVALVYPETAYAAWVLMLEGLLALLVAVLWRRIANPALRLTTVALMLLNTPYFLELIMGQFTFASTTLCCLALLLPGSSCLFALSVLLKPFTLASAPALLRNRRYWLVLLAAVFCVVALNVPYFVKSPEEWQHFYSTNFTPYDSYGPGNYGFLYLLYLLASRSNLPFLMDCWETLAAVFWYGALAITAIFVFLARSSSVRLGVSALLLAHFLTYPHVWEHHMTAPCVLAATMMTVPHSNNRTYCTILICLALLALPTPFAWLDNADGSPVSSIYVDSPLPHLMALLLPKVVPTLILYVTCMMMLCRNGLISVSAAIREVLAPLCTVQPDPEGESEPFRLD